MPTTSASTRSHFIDATSRFVRIRAERSDGVRTESPKLCSPRPVAPGQRFASWLDERSRTRHGSRMKPVAHEGPAYVSSSVGQLLLVLISAAALSCKSSSADRMASRDASADAGMARDSTTVPPIGAEDAGPHDGELDGDAAVFIDAAPGSDALADAGTALDGNAVDGDVQEAGLPSWAPRVCSASLVSRRQATTRWLETACFIPPACSSTGCPLQFRAGSTFGTPATTASLHWLIRALHWGPTPGAACTEHDACGTGRCDGDLGETLSGCSDSRAPRFSACNQDNTFEAPSSDRTLCAIPYPYQISPLEGPRGNSMAVDAQHRLYVVDPFNNRVLRFDDPIGTDAVADAVWGQADFDHRECNQGLARASASSLCTGEPRAFYPNYYFSAGLDVTSDGGTLWVADLGNHRVLRIPTSTRTADLVLGQASMSDSGDACNAVPMPLDRMCKPNAVRFDESTGQLYVLDGDARTARILVFHSPLSTG